MTSKEVLTAVYVEETDTLWQTSLRLAVHNVEIKTIRADVDVTRQWLTYVYVHDRVIERLLVARNEIDTGAELTNLVILHKIHTEINVILCRTLDTFR